MVTGTAPNLDIGRVRSEVGRIVKANLPHFYALSAIFLFPLSLFSVFIYLSLLSVPKTTITIKTLALPLIFSPFVFNILSLFAVGTITYSTYQGFYNRPLNLVSSIKSLLHTFMPLAATAIVSEVILILIAAAFALSVGLVSRGVELFLGYEIYYHHNYFTALVLVIFVVVVVYLQVNWSLASVIVVVESKWGLEALRRSKYLVRGMRWVSFLLMFIYGSFIVFYVWVNTGFGSVNEYYYSSSSYWWMRYLLIVQALLTSFVVALLILFYMAALAVLYVYCKVTHGELAAWEVAEVSAREYVSLPFEDGKVPLLG